MTEEQKGKWLVNTDGTGRISHPDHAVQISGFVDCDVTAILEVSELLVMIARNKIESEAPAPAPAKPKRKRKLLRIRNPFVS